MRFFQTDPQPIVDAITNAVQTVPTTLAELIARLFGG